MTLGEFFEIVSGNPSILIFYFIAVPLTALLAWIFGKGQGHLSPWKYLYTVLIYLACVPGIFSVTLNVYHFLFERQSIYDSNIYTQILPILSMILTIVLIRKNIDLDLIPGFGRLSSLMLLIAIVLTIMWIIDRTYFLSITIIPFTYVLLMLVAIFIILRLAWNKIVS